MKLNERQEKYLRKIIREELRKKEDSHRIKMDTAKITNIKFEDIDYNDHPDYCDVFISEADYDGEPMTEQQLDEINEDREFVHEKLFEYLF